MRQKPPSFRKHINKDKTISIIQELEPLIQSAFADSRQRFSAIITEFEVLKQNVSSADSGTYLPQEERFSNLMIDDFFQEFESFSNEIKIAIQTAKNA